jgi:hypothetical protein
MCTQCAAAFPHNAVAPAAANTVGIQAASAPKLCCRVHTELFVRLSYAYSVHLQGIYASHCAAPTVGVQHLNACTSHCHLQLSLCP